MMDHSRLKSNDATSLLRPSYFGFQSVSALSWPVPVLKLGISVGERGTHSGMEMNAVSRDRHKRVLAMSATPDKGSGTDIWRDSLLRYAGYANEVGEAFRFVTPGLVIPSYGVSIAYVCGDTADKAYKARKAGNSTAAVAKMAIDVLLWQSLASVAIPGFTIHTVVRAVKAVVSADAAKRLPPPLKKWLPTAVGLGIIPVIVHPIDDGVTWAMDATIRKYLHDNDP